MKRLLPVALAVLCGSGCLMTPKDFAPIIKALSSDPATAHVVVHSAYFSIEIDRANPLTNSLPHSVENGKITVGK